MIESFIQSCVYSVLLGSWNLLDHWSSIYQESRHKIGRVLSNNLFSKYRINTYVWSLSYSRLAYVCKVNWIVAQMIQQWSMTYIFINMPSGIESGIINCNDVYVSHTFTSGKAQ
jgi:hypothetical protein